MTTLEVLLVLSITGGVFSVATYTVVDYARYSQVVDARAEAAQLQGFVETYHVMFGALPKGLADIEDPVGFMGGDMARVRDPWDRPYAYVQRNNLHFLVFSRGPDGLPQTADDIHPHGSEPGSR